MEVEGYSPEELPDILVGLYPLALSTEELRERLEYEIEETAAALAPCGDLDLVKPSISPYWVFLVLARRAHAQINSVPKNLRKLWFDAVHRKYIAYRQKYASEIARGEKPRLCSLPPIPKGREGRTTNRKEPKQ